MRFSKSRSSIPNSFFFSSSYIILCTSEYLQMLCGALRQFKPKRIEEKFTCPKPNIPYQAHHRCSHTNARTHAHARTNARTQRSMCAYTHRRTRQVKTKSPLSKNKLMVRKRIEPTRTKRMHNSERFR